MARRAAVSAIAVVAALAAACGGSGKPRAIPDPCKVLTSAQVASAVGVAVAHVDGPRNDTSSGRRGCAWVLRGTKRAVTVTIARPALATDPAKRAKTARKLFGDLAASPRALPVKHLGDKAVAEVNVAEVLKGDTVLAVALETKGSPTPVSQAQGNALLQLAKQALAHI